MKIGLILRPWEGLDALFEEARAADRQGFHSVWLSDHLTSPYPPGNAYDPYEALTLMTAIGARTERVQLGWAMLNLSLRPPVLAAKMLATLDQVTKGRVICTVGSGWFKPEYEAYDIPLIDDHDERSAYGREVVRLFKEVFEHPAPEVIDFDGSYIHTKGLAFEPAPYRKPHPPIWIGGDSDITLDAVRELADGWVMLLSDRARVEDVTARPDWPTRPMDLVRSVRIHVAPDRNDAIAEAKQAFEAGVRRLDKTLDEYLENQIIGTPDECIAKLKEMESWGITVVRLMCADAAHQERIATMVLPGMD